MGMRKPGPMGKKGKKKGKKAVGKRVHESQWEKGDTGTRQDTRYERQRASSGNNKSGELIALGRAYWFKEHIPSSKIHAGETYVLVDVKGDEGEFRGLYQRQKAPEERKPEILASDDGQRRRSAALRRPMNLSEKAEVLERRRQQYGFYE